MTTWPAGSHVRIRQIIRLIAALAFLIAGARAAEQGEVRAPEPDKPVPGPVNPDADKPPAPGEATAAPQEELPEVMVWGRPWRDIMEVPQIESPGLEPTVTIVDQTAIERQNPYTVVDAMKYVPGAWVERRGRKVKQFFSIRGQQYPYPEYSIDGAWQREFHELPYFISAANFEKIEVLRAPSALMTGPGGVVGIINLVPRRHEKTETIIRTTYGSYNTSTVHVNHGGSYETFSYALGFGNRTTDGLDRRHAAENMTDVYGRLEFRPIDRLSVSLDLFGLYGKRELEQAELPASARFREELSEYDPFRGVLTVAKVRYEEADWAATELVMSYARRNHDFKLAGESDPAVEDIDEEDYEYGFNLTQSFELLPDNVLRFGGLYNRWAAPEGKRFYVGRRTDLETASGVIVDEQRIGPLVLNAGYRYSRTYVNNFGAFSIDGSGRGFGNVPPVEDEWEKPVHSGSGGAAYYITDDLSLHANLAVGQIEPRAGTLDTSFQRPDQETRYMIDVGVRKELKGIGIGTLTGFYVIRDDALVLSGQTADVGGRVYELYENRDQEQRGIEIDLRSARIEGLVELFLNTVFMETDEKVDGHMERDEKIPEVILSGGLYAQHGAFDLSFYAKHVSPYENSRFVPASLGPQPLGDFVELNASAGYAFGKDRQYRIFVSGENLTDEEYSTVPGYPDWGIRLYAGAQFSF